MLDRGEVPLTMQSCHGCHSGVVSSYLQQHGMATTVGTVGEPTVGSVANELSGRRYEISKEGDGPWMTTIEADGGRRRQRLVGRIGAGALATSWVTAQVDPVTGVSTGRLFFAPVETVRGPGLVLAPFEHHKSSAGPEMELTEGCLTCHVDQVLASLPDAAVGSGQTVFPANALGESAFSHLTGIGCGGCHGATDFHVELMTGSEQPIGLGLLELGKLPPASQRDVCARCHLEGDSRWSLIEGRMSTARPLPAQVPVVVTAEPDADFRFVGQLERLALSACFQATLAMTCTTCHQPHLGVAAQGVEALEAVCVSCHPAIEEKHTARTVEEVTGEASRTVAGCIDCHLRRSQPFDLTQISAVDHWIRRDIEPPVSGAPHRQHSGSGREVMLFDRERIADALDTAGGRQWENAVMGMSFSSMGRFEEARAAFSQLPAPGSPAAVEAAAPTPLAPVMTRPSLHQTRALILLSAGDFGAADAAFSDAIALDPASPGARLGRARLRLDGGNVLGVLEDTQVVIDNFPRAEQPWRLRLELAERAGRFDLALQALEAIVERWPSDAAAWQKLGLILQQEGQADRAAEALRRGRALSPSLDLRTQPGR